MASDYTVKYSRVSPTVVRAVLTVPPSDHQTPISKLILVMDVSGSMAGQRLNLVKNMATQLLNVTGTAELIIYNHTFEIFSSITALPALVASGGTSFTSALRGLLTRLLTIDDLVQVVFLTDGKDEDNGNNPKDYLKTFTKALTGRNVSIHAMGVDSSAQTDFLLSITGAGTIPGSFGYLTTAAADEVSVSREFDRLRAAVAVGRQVQFRGQTYLVTGDSLSLYLQDSTMDANPAQLEDEVDYFSFQVEQQALNASTIKLPAVTQLQEQATALYTRAGKLDRLQRKELRTRLGNINQVISSWYLILSQTTSLTNEQLAKLNVAARESRSNKFLKVTTKQTHTNAELIVKEDLAIQEASRLCGEHLTGLPLACTISQLCVDELLAEGDCLGVGISAISRETCLVDPTHMQVQDVSISYYGCDVFLDLAVWNNKLNVSKFGALNTITTDEARNPVSGVLPLYLNKTHWSVATNYVRRMASHLTCLDPMLGNSATIFYSYLRAYLKCITYQDTKHQEIAAQLLETLHHLPSVLPEPLSFVNDVSKRSPVRVPNLELLMAWYKLPHPLWRDQEEVSYALLLQYVKEEQDRREQRFKSLTSPSVFFDFPADIWINPYVSSNLLHHSQGIDTRALRSWLEQYAPAALPAYDSRCNKIATASSSSGSNVVLDVSCYNPILSNYATSKQMTEREILMAVQQMHYPHSQEFIDHYTDYVTMPDSEVHSKLVELAQQQLSLLRTSALSVAQEAINDDTLHSILNELSGTKDPILWVAALFAHCKVGRNIKKFMKVARTVEQCRMIIRGEYDIAPLLGLSVPVIVPTVSDMTKIKSLTMAYHSLPQAEVLGVWFPKNNILKELIRTFGLEVIKEIFPKSVHFYLHSLTI